jgi:DNA-binding MarR family transcriptional regulator
MEPSPEHSRIILDQLRRIVQALRQSSSESETAFGLNGAQAWVLRAVADHEGASVNAIAALTFTHQSTVSEVVAKLEAKGMVTRARSAEDGRKVELRLTPAGTRVVSGGLRSGNEMLMAAVQALPPEAAAQLAAGLTALADAAGLADRPARMFFEDGR